MKVFKNLDDIQMTEDTSVALGNFDGVHVGHRDLISHAVEYAHEAGLASAVFTFSNHPRNMFSEEKVKNILYPEDKEAIIESLGVDYMFDIPFTMDICTMSAQDFLEELLLKKFRAKHLVCGFDYTYGYKALGTAKTLEEEGEKRGVGVEVVEAIKVGGEVVSSTLIRQYIQEGEMEKCDLLLGRNYSIDGVVEMGNQLGRTIGFPTCNVVVDESMVAPMNGVYITICSFDGERHPSITNVGVKPTIGSDFTKNIETHIFDIDRDLYGKKIRVEFLKKMRAEKKFDSVKELQEEIRRNCQTARAYHGIPVR